MQRRKFIQCSAVAVIAPAIIVPGRARAAEFSYKLAQNLPATHPLYLRAVEAADKIRTDTKGRVDIQVFPSSQLGSDTDSLSQVRAGGIELFTLSGLILSTLVAPASISGIGFAFPDYDKVWAAMDGDLGAYIRDQIKKAGLMVMDKIWDNGYRQTTSSTKPISVPDDFKGFKIRVPPSPLWTSMFKAFGAAPASINFNEVYSALQTKVVEGQENPLAIVSTAKLYEVQKYCSLTNHMWDGYWVIVNQRAWERLPKDLQAIVATHLNDGAVLERVDVAKLNATLRTDLEKKGLAFNAPANEPFRDVLRSAGFYQEWKQKYGADAWAILERYSGKLV
jgi:tripartite ATP-independent transporter DctP family solute receptor